MGSAMAESCHTLPVIKERRYSYALMASTFARDERHKIFRTVMVYWFGLIKKDWVPECCKQYIIEMKIKIACII